MNEKLENIGSEADIGLYDTISVYDPGDLKKTAEGFGILLEKYLREYERAGLKAKRFADIDAFLAAYLGRGGNTDENGQEADTE